MAILGPGDNLRFEKLHGDEGEKREKEEKVIVTGIHI
jgi:hypothetical protein